MDSHNAGLWLDGRCDPDMGESITAQPATSAGELQMQDEEILESGAARWDRRYRGSESTALPSAVLTAHLDWLPPRGTALDLACGLGANALALAAHGLAVEAWDYSPVAIARLDETARRRQLPVKAVCRDVVAEPPATATFDVIVVAHFLERSLFPHIMSALTPGGWLLYQTFTTAAVRGPGNPAFRLAGGELLRLCAPLQLRAYREDGGHAPANDPLAGMALLVAQKPTGGV